MFYLMNSCCHPPPLLKLAFISSLNIFIIPALDELLTPSFLFLQKQLLFTTYVPWIWLFPCSSGFLLKLDISGSPYPEFLTLLRIAFMAMCLFVTWLLWFCRQTLSQFLVNIALLILLWQYWLVKNQAAPGDWGNSALFTLALAWANAMQIYNSTLSSF